MAVSTLQDDKKKALNLAIAQIEKSCGKGSIMRMGADARRSASRSIPTGAINLDAAIGVGGIPRGRVTEIYGPESSGKTTLCLHVVANAQRDGRRRGVHRRGARARHGVRAEAGRRRREPARSRSRTRASRRSRSARSSCARARWTSSSSTRSRRWCRRRKSKATWATRTSGLQARLMSQALRKLTGAIARSKTSVVFINQLREKIGVMFGNPETTTGGKALKFYASVRLDIRRIGPVKDKEDVVGSHVRVKVVKNKVAAAVQAGRVRHHVRGRDQPRVAARRHRGGGGHHRQVGRVVQLQRPEDRAGPREREDVSSRTTRR